MEKNSKKDYKEMYRNAYAAALNMMRDGRLDKSVFEEIFPKVTEVTITDREYIENHLNLMKKKRPALILKGLEKHAFDNEWNTIQQLSCFWSPMQKQLAKEYAMQWASWGALNLSKNINK